jgi:SAM-dependent methyltransferase
MTTAGITATFHRHELELFDFCHVCGHREFEHAPVLWPALVSAWGLSEDEARYIDVQQGTRCVECSSNVRSIALARAIVRFLDFDKPLTRFVETQGQANLRVLEINEAGSLHSILRRLRGHQLVSYPEADMRSLSYPRGAFDLVVHSDTLEHVSDPLKGLEECRRVLDDRGALVFTVPVVIGRLTRTRAMLPPSYHGHEASQDPGMLVHTEFGADVWTLVIRAGFSSCELLPFRFPAGLAILARP